ncbi:uncharacterized protein LOC100490488 isoform X3 [Xenopus tropicalis]|uniref:Uncharacterized protein LOC100490488 isoform X2 n=1 Tax=Xenopus tropicalis TaxID=8364 RepID=A0A8J1JA16_XENTR|nr:uncharacterized protein LOC100490488 isoform X2 [Xenopus tropicalis]XP_031754709.1 uncharacterized protein LOC100490488 isoform X3 [Xenopus tropicalis]
MRIALALLLGLVSCCFTPAISNCIRDENNEEKGLDCIKKSLKENKQQTASAIAAFLCAFMDSKDQDEQTKAYQNLQNDIGCTFADPRASDKSLKTELNAPQYSFLRKIIKLMNTSDSQSETTPDCGPWGLLLSNVEKKLNSLATSPEDMQTAQGLQGNERHARAADLLGSLGGLGGVAGGLGGAAGIAGGASLPLGAITGGLGAAAGITGSLGGATGMLGGATGMLGGATGMLGGATSPLGMLTGGQGATGMLGGGGANGMLGGATGILGSPGCSGAGSDPIGSLVARLSISVSVLEKLLNTLTNLLGGLGVLTSGIGGLAGGLGGLAGGLGGVASLAGGLGGVASLAGGLGGLASLTG